MMEDSRVLKHIQSGSLELIYWDVFGGYDTPGWEYATQALMYNHALLTMWGESRRLAFLDIDEYIATPVWNMLPGHRPSRWPSAGFA